MGTASICIATMHFYDIDVFLIVVTTFPLNLAIIGQMVKNRNTSSKFKMAATTMLNIGYLAFSIPCMYSVSNSQNPNYLKLWLLRFLVVTYVFKINVAIVLLNLAMIGRIVKKWQPHFSKLKMAATAILNCCNYAFQTSSISSKSTS